MLALQRPQKLGPTCIYCSILSKAVKYPSVSEAIRMEAWKVDASCNGGEASGQVVTGSVQALKALKPAHCRGPEQLVLKPSPTRMGRCLWSPGAHS